MDTENGILRERLQEAERARTQMGREWNARSDELANLQMALQEIRTENEKLREDVVKATQATKKIRTETSSLRQKLKETETAFAEAKKHFIMAPALVPSLQSLTGEVRMLQKTVQKNGEKTAEALARRPPEDFASGIRSLSNEVKTVRVDLKTKFDKTAEAITTRRAEGQRHARTLQQMKRVLHDIGRYPKRQRTRADGTDGMRNVKHGRICYCCRSKGHLANDCPRARNSDMVESPAGPNTSYTQQRTESPREPAVNETASTVSRSRS